MDWISKLERRCGSWAIPNLTLYLIAIQAIGVVMLLGGYVDFPDMVLVGGLVQVGQWTRLFSFLMIPRTLSPIWLFFAFYIFYLMGTALEHEWGTFRYNLFILCGYLLTIAAAFVAPAAVLTNTFFLGCVFLAFATLFPNFELHLFFILPVKVKWLGWLTAGFYVLVLFAGDTGSRADRGAGERRLRVVSRRPAGHWRGRQQGDAHGERHADPAAMRDGRSGRVGWSLPASLLVAHHAACPSWVVCGDCIGPASRTGPGRQRREQ